MNRHALFLLAAAGSVGVPAMTSNSDWKSAFQRVDQAEAQNVGETGESLDGVHGDDAKAFMGKTAGSPIANITAEGTSGRVLAASTLTGPEVISFTELLRFEITTDWIFQHWDRVSTVTEQPTLQGYRVPVVTGTQPFDLAGSLSYYFDKDQKLQRIVFHGNTGDPRPLAQWVTTQHALRARESNQAGLQLYQRQWHGQPVSELRVSPASVVRQEQTFAKYQVDLLLERPVGSTIFKPGEKNGPSWRL
ncbi:MAG: hypothetical protein MPJ50_15180 [Pirellulales bacterium]|nr:hypothetical protein [Pirellulales bacterium]